MKGRSSPNPLYMELVDFRYHGILERAAWHILNFHRIFAAALHPETQVTSERDLHNLGWFVQIKTGPQAPRYKIRFPQTAPLEVVQPSDIFAMPAVQQSYRYLQAVFPRLLALRSSLATLHPHDFFEQRQLRRPLRELFHLATTIGQEKLTAAQFKQIVNQDLATLHQQALEVFGSYQNLKNSLQNIVADQCAAHLTTP